MKIVPSTITFNFNPNGTFGTVRTITIRPKGPNAGEQPAVLKCGEVVVNPFGRIRVIEGNYDFNTDQCKRIKDDQEVPTSS